MQKSGGGKTMRMKELVEKYKGRWVLLRAKGNRAGIEVVAHGKTFEEIRRIQDSSKEHLPALFVTEKLCDKS